MQAIYVDLLLKGVKKIGNKIIAIVYYDRCVWSYIVFMYIP